MNLSRKWLNEFVEIDAGDREFAEAMTLSGSKVELTHDMGEEISNVVVGRILSMERLMALLNGNAAKRFGFGTPLEEGQPADLTVFDLDKPYVVDPERFQTMGRATPFEGWRVDAAVVMTLCDGKIVYQEDVE